VQQARDVVYRSGRGFDNERSDQHAAVLLKAEAEALGRGVDVRRIQTSPHAATRWADGLASLVERYPDKLRVYADFTTHGAADFGLVDPDGVRPIVVALFSAPVPGTLPIRSRTIAAFFYYQHRELAKILADDFGNRTQALRQINVQT
jgi:hypothetical protein